MSCYTRFPKIRYTTRGIIFYYIHQKNKNNFLYIYTLFPKTACNKGRFLCKRIYANVLSCYTHCYTGLFCV